MPSIPPLELIGDALEASLYRLDSGTLLALDTPPELPASDLVRPHGPLVVRYALPYLNKERAIVPGLFASEYGAMLVGREAWDFALSHNNLHPRADLLGFTTDGTEAEVMLRELDFGRGVEVWAYATPDERKPLTRLVAYWAKRELGSSALLANYLPAWQPAPRA